jgi:formate--tetrahydrofolate ligase
MPTDFEIASQFPRRPMTEIGAKLGLAESDLIPYGRDVAKVDLAVLERPRARPAPPRLVLVSALTPTPAGEGKTTTSIGLGEALATAGPAVCLRAARAVARPVSSASRAAAPAAAPAGCSRADDINLHFTGDFHAITAAHNLLGGGHRQHSTTAVAWLAVRASTRAGCCGAA